MENIFQADQLIIDRDLMERTNPIFNTAKMTLFQLAASGHSDAAAIADRLGLTRDETQNSSSVKVSDEILQGGNIILETRFLTMEELAKKAGCDSVVDLPCGYTPRAIRFAKEGLRFTGLDLPAAIEEGEPVLMSMIDEDRRHLISFKSVDATNYESLRDALKDVEGSICITTEGLLMYFTDSEAAVLCDNIRKLLQEHGGCWITADPESAIQYIITMRSLCGDRFMEIMQQSKKRTEEKADVSIGQGTLIINPLTDIPACIGKAMAFLAEHGLKAERIPVGKNMPALKSLSGFPEEQRSALKEALNNCAYWKMTLLENAKTLDTVDVGTQDFNIEAKLDKETLFLRLMGRVDTISAPRLLAFYEKTAAESPVSKVRIDCSRLEYISSAGLRVLLIMQKRSTGGVTITHLNSSVSEIFEQTGFDDILDVEA